MRKLLLGGLAALVTISAVATPHQASAGNGFAAGLFGGLAAGTMLGIAATGPRYYYGPAPVYVGPGPVYAAPACYWAPGAPHWDPYRGGWVRPRVRVCE